MKDCLGRSTVAENNSLSGPDQCAHLLMNYMRGNWETVLSNIETVAPTDVNEMVLIRAAESLEAREYLMFLKRVYDLRISNRISDKVFRSAIGPSHYKEGFLALNYQNPEVREFVENLRAWTPAESQGGLDDILSGKRKRDLEQRWKAEKTGKVDGNLLLPPRTPGPAVQGITTITPSAITPIARTEASDDSLPAASLAQTPSTTAEGRLRLWVWVVGITALAVIAWLLWSRRR